MTDLSCSNTPPDWFGLPRLPRNPQGRLQAMYRQVRQWRSFTETPRPVAPGSSLAGDDKLFPDATPSQLAWHGIGSAIDHLDMFLTTLEQARTAYTYAHFTTARSAGISSAHALWLLDAESRSVRQQRALRVAHEEYTQEIKALNELRAIGSADQRLDEHIRKLRGQVEKVLLAADDLGVARSPVAAKLNETNILRHVMQRYGGDDPNLPALVAGHLIEWRRTSCTAHGLRWPALLGARNVHTIDGATYVRSTASIEALDTAAMSAYNLTALAINYYEQRRQAPRVGAA